MSSESSSVHLSSITDWVKAHIPRVFGALSDDDCIAAVNDTFAPSLQGSLNGRPLDFPKLTSLAVAICRGAKGDGMQGATIDWEYIMDVPDDPTNRNGSCGTFYYIRGFRAPLPGTVDAVDVERPKVVCARIESQSSDLTIDSRRITNLVAVASNQAV